MSHTTEVFQQLQADDPPMVAGYRLAARLGAGGMGRVYLSHTQGGRPVAIKVVRPELADDPDFRRRFGREIKAARKVRGAYTAELIDADADGVPPWLATLYVPGPSLTEAVTRRGPLPAPAVLWLMAGVAEALQAIYAEGIVHRDLKPSKTDLHEGRQGQHRVVCDSDEVDRTARTRLPPRGPDRMAGRRLIRMAIRRGRRTESGMVRRLRPRPLRGGSAGLVRCFPFRR